jgi:hypothetical protein
MMKTKEQILADLLADPRYSTMIKMVNGEPVAMSDDERLRALNEWVDAEFEQQVKKWLNVEDFMAEFTMPEKAQIALSEDPTIATLRFELTTWLSAVHADDPRVVMGLSKLVELGIISEQRKTEITSTP